LSDKDIYVNIIGGIRTSEPAIDLPVCLAIVSSVLGKPVDRNLISFGEVSLSGEVREVLDLESRLREARRFGFKKALVPNSGGRKFTSKKINIQQVGTLKEALKYIFK
jgi:DNA repair protein RadA/Sms